MTKGLSLKIPYGRQEILAEDIEAVVQTLKSDFLTQGPAVSEFEKAFAEKVHSKYAVAINNATAALHLAFKVLNKDLSKKVLVTPITFAASSNCVLFEKGHVEFVDIDPKTFNIDLDLLEKRIEANPQAYQGMIVVDFAGLPVDTEKLRKLANKHKLWIIEDACHAIGGVYLESRKTSVTVGSAEYSDLCIFSFHPVKHIATGEGGMITTNDEKLYKHLLKLRSHGIERDSSQLMEASHGGWYHEMQELGYNYRMPDINASLGLSQIRRLSSNIEKRQAIAKRYLEQLKDLPIKFQEAPSGFANAYHLFVIQTEKRKELYEFLKAKDIYCQVHYIPVYWHPYYRTLGFEKGLCPNAELFYGRALSLPMYHAMTTSEQDYVIRSVREFFKG